jgi:hypothetical protein
VRLKGAVDMAAAVKDAEEAADEELALTRHQEPAKSPSTVCGVRIR